VVVGRRVIGRAAAHHHRLDARDVHDVVLHAPARKVGGGLPLRLGEIGAGRLDGLPDLFEEVDELLVTPLVVCHHLIVPAEATTARAHGAMSSNSSSTSSPRASTSSASWTSVARSMASRNSWPSSVSWPAPSTRPRLRDRSSAAPISSTE